MSYLNVRETQIMTKRECKFLSIAHKGEMFLKGRKYKFVTNFNNTK